MRSLSRKESELLASLRARSELADIQGRKGDSVRLSGYASALQSGRYVELAAWNEPNGNGLSVVKCPNYWECGDYALMGRFSPARENKVQVCCPWHAQQTERNEAAAAAESRPQ